MPVDAPRIRRWPASAIAGTLVLALIPVACAMVAVSSARASGPGWLTPNYDLEYNYLLNALRFEQRLPILFFIQPATTLGYLYAGVIYISHAVAAVGSPNVVEDVWRHPEVYVDRIHACLVVLLFVASFVAGVLVWRRTGSVWAGVALQTGLLLLASIAICAGLIWPETVIVVVGVLFAAAVALFVLDERAGVGLCVTLGVLGALGIAAKVTFVVVTLAPAMLARSRRQLMLYVAALAGGTGVLLAPIFGRLSHLVGFLNGFASRTGGYGGGSAGFDVRGYLHGAALLVRQNTIPFAMIVLSAGVCVALWRTASLHGSQRSELRALGLLTLVELLMYGVVARQPYPRYLIPAVLLMGVNLVIIQRIALAIGRQRRRAVQACFVVGLVLVSGVWLRNTASARASARSDTAARLATVEAAARLQRSGAVLVLGTWASSPAHALEVGAFWIGDAWSSLGEQLYPGQLFLTGDGYLRTWTEGLGAGWEWPNVNAPLSRSAEEQEWRRFDHLLQDHRVVVQGDWDDIVPGLQRNPRISIHAIHRSRLESLIELRRR